MFVFLLASGIDPMWTWLLLPVVIALLTVFTTAVSMIVSALNPRFRDIGIIWSVAVTALFYATPVLYPLEIVSGKLGQLLALNPLAPIFELARKWVIDPTAPGPAELAGGAIWLLVPAALFVRDLPARRVGLQPRGPADRRGAVSARVVVALIAVAAIAWLGVMERDTRLLARASDATSARDYAAADRDLRRADALQRGPDGGSAAGVPLSGDAPGRRGSRAARGRRAPRARQPHGVGSAADVLA